MSNRAYKITKWHDDESFNVSSMPKELLEFLISEDATYKNTYGDIGFIFINEDILEKLKEAFKDTKDEDIKEIIAQIEDDVDIDKEVKYICY